MIYIVYTFNQIISYMHNLCILVIIINKAIFLTNTSTFAEVRFIIITYIRYMYIYIYIYISKKIAIIMAWV